MNLKELDEKVQAAGLIAIAAIAIALLSLILSSCIHCTPCNYKHKMVSAREAKNMKALGMDVYCLEDKNK